ncbi:HlyD family secretion protein [Brevibacillus sp. BC25]|uniref:HlyD family secretion protein n=1 Tax=Brevibacillus sp. BC25 TaxID=1144308 RepID=UPI0002713137|nr:biotin/lipoyl-binding protein [Brevibacillus sp. BC25]EJL21745.1 multidrug resistance efflux pump [Brevibacillus sp. BC25]
MKPVVRSICIGGLLLALSGCNWTSENHPSLSGTIEAIELPIVAEVGGLVTNVTIEEGSAVKKGQVLVQIDKRSYQITVAEAQAALDQATARLEEARAGSRDTTIQRSMANVQQANANIQLAQARKNQAEAGKARAAEQMTQTESQWQGAQQTLLYHQKRLEESTALFEKGAISAKDLDTQKEAVSQAKTQADQWAAQVAQTQA